MLANLFINTLHSLNINYGGHSHEYLYMYEHIIFNQKIRFKSTIEMYLNELVAQLLAVCYFSVLIVCSHTTP